MPRKNVNDDGVSPRKRVIIRQPSAPSQPDPRISKAVEDETKRLEAELAQHHAEHRLEQLRQEAEAVRQKDTALVWARERREEHEHLVRMSASLPVTVWDLDPDCQRHLARRYGIDLDRNTDWWKQLMRAGCPFEVEREWFTDMPKFNKSAFDEMIAAANQPPPTGDGLLAQAQRENWMAAEAKMTEELVLLRMELDLEDDS